MLLLNYIVSLSVNLARQKGLQMYKIFFGANYIDFQFFTSFCKNFFNLFKFLRQPICYTCILEKVNYKN